MTITKQQPAVKQYLQDLLGREPTESEVLECIQSLFLFGRALTRFVQRNNAVNAVEDAWADTQADHAPSAAALEVKNSSSFDARVTRRKNSKLRSKK